MNDFNVSYEMNIHYIVVQLALLCNYLDEFLTLKLVIRGILSYDQTDLSENTTFRNVLENK